MSNIAISLIIILALLIGYYLGTKRNIITDSSNILEEIKRLPKKLDKPKPGVVNHLTEEEIREKHDPVKQGQKEAWRETLGLPPQNGNIK